MQSTHVGNLRELSARYRRVLIASMLLLALLIPIGSVVEAHSWQSSYCGHDYDQASQFGDTWRIYYVNGYDVPTGYGYDHYHNTDHYRFGYSFTHPLGEYYYVHSEGPIYCGSGGT